MLRGRVPGQDAAGPVPRLAAPTATSRCRSRRSRCSRASLSKVAAYGFLRIVLPLFPYASVHFQMLMLVIALVSILWATRGRVHDPRRAAGRRLLERRAAQLHHARDLLAAAPGRAGRAAADGQPRRSSRRRCSSSSPRWRPAPAARRTCADMGGIAFRAPVLATLFLIVTLATLAMPGSSNFVGEFLILLGVFQTKLAISVIAFARRRRRRGATRCGCSSPSMHNRVGPTVTSREIGLAEAVRDRADRGRDPGARVLSAVRAQALGAVGDAPRSRRRSRGAARRRG